MNTRRWFSILLIVLGVLLVLSVGLAAAQEDIPGNDPSGGDLSLSPDSRSNVIPLQGRLTDAMGKALNGSYTVIFSLYGQYAGGSPYCVSGQVLTLTDGLFNTYVGGENCKIDGRRLFLGISVGSDGEMTPRLSIDTVPYAWSLRPGAVISDSLGSVPILHLENWGTGGRGLRSYAMATSGANYGVVGASRSPDGYGGYFYNNGGGIGLYGQSSAAGGVGVLAESVDSSPDLVLGGNANTGSGDDGILTSDPDYASSDIILKSNDTVRIDLDNDADGEDADFEIHNAADTLIFDVDDSGAVVYGGPGIAAFPRPAYDSGWTIIGAGDLLTLDHNLGGDVDRYVVELTCQHPSYGRHIFGLGGDVTSGAFYGVFWRNLTTASVGVERATNDAECPQVRVRIWMYP